MNRRWLTVLALCLLAAAPCRGSELFGSLVDEILFEPPLPPALRASAAGALAVQVGEPLTPRALRTSIQALFRTGRFADIEADAVKTPTGSRLTFRYKQAWFIGEVRVEGVPRPPSDSELLAATRLRLGEPFTNERLVEAVRSLRSVLVQHGLHEPLVEYSLNEVPATQQVDIRLSVSSGMRARIGTLLVAGEHRPLEAPEIRRIARWKTGSPYTQDRVQRGIRLLRRHFESQGFWGSAIHVETADYLPAENQVTLVVRIDRGPRTSVRVEGAKIGPRKLRRHLPIFARGAVDEDLLVTGGENLRNYFQSQGYFRAEVESEVELDTDEEIVVVYRVDRGTKSRLRAVEIEGNQYFGRATISERLQIDEGRMEASSGRYTQALFDEDMQSIRALYLSNGFLEARAEGALIDSPGGLTVRIDIDEGPQTFVSRLVLSGLADSPVDMESFEFSAAQGQPFSEANVLSDRQRILTEFYDAGYRNVEFDWRTEPGPGPDQAVVHYDIERGARTMTGKTILFGSRKTRDEILQRRIELLPGTPLSLSRMFATQRNLYDLGVFSKVDVAIQNPEGVEDAKSVLLHVEEARRWAVGAGGGAEFARIGRNTAELTNPAGDTTFSPRVTLEVTRLNVWGKAHTMGVRTRLSLLQQRGLFTYEAPRWFDSDRWVMTVTGLYDTFRNVNTFTGRRLEGALQLSQQLNRTTTVLYRYAYRRTSIDQNTLHIEPLLVPLVSQPVRVGQVSSTYISDRRDDPTDTTTGMYNTVNIALASKLLGSQPNFARLLAQNSTYHPLRPRVVFARTLQLGVNLPWAGRMIEGVEQAATAGRPDPRVPISERFFGGGANSHRGFPYNQAGPRDPATGFPLGGGSQLLNSMELRFPLPGADFSGVLFHDAGNVYSRPGRISFRSEQRVRGGGEGAEEFDFDYMVHALGLGFRYRTPIGPVRFDLAYVPNAPRFVGFDGTREQLLMGTGTFREQRISSFQLHFSLGQTF